MSAEQNQKIWVESVKKRLVLGREYELLPRFAQMVKDSRYTPDTDLFLALVSDPEASSAYQQLIESTAPPPQIKVSQSINQNVGQVTGATIKGLDFGSVTSNVTIQQVQTGGRVFGFSVDDLGWSQKSSQPGAQEPPLPSPDEYRPPETLRHPAAIYCELGHAYLRIGEQYRQARQEELALARSAEAARAFQEAIRIHPGSTLLHQYLAVALARQGKSAEALQTVVETISLDPSSAAEMLPQANEWLNPELARAIPDLEKAWLPVMKGAKPSAKPSAQPQAKQSAKLPAEPSTAPSAELPSSTLALLEQFMGRVYLYQDQFGNAAHHFQAALDLDAEDFYSLEGLGKALWMQGQRSQAEETFARGMSYADQAGNLSRQEKIRQKLVDMYLEEERYAEALPLIQAGLDLHGTLQASFQAARSRALLGLGRFEEARQAGVTALSLVPSMAEAAWVQAEALLRLGDAPGALTAVEQALAIDPEHTLSFRTKAEILLSMSQDTDKANRLLEIYTQRRPQDPLGWGLLARALRALGRPTSDILPPLQQGLKVAQGEQKTPLLQTAAELHLQEGRLEAADDALQQIQALDPQGLSLAWHLAMGEVKLRQSDFAQAQANFKQVLQAEPQNVVALHGQAACQTEAGAFAQAAETWRQVIAVGDDKANAGISLARVLSQAGDQDSALAALEEAMQAGLSYSASVEAYQLKAEVLKKLERPGEEIAAAYSSAAQNASWDSDNETAEKLYRLALKEDDHYVEAYWGLAESLRLLSYQPGKEDLYQESLQVWNAGIALRPLLSHDEAWTYITRAVLNEIALQRPEFPVQETNEAWWGAVTYCERGLLLNGDYEYLWGYLGHFYRNLGVDQNALRIAEKASSLDPSNLFIKGERAAILSNVGRYEEAEKEVDALRAAAYDPWVESIKAYLLTYTGRYQQALELIDKLIEAEKDKLWNYDFRVETYIRLALAPDANPDWRRKIEAAYREILKIYAESDLSEATNMYYAAQAHYHLGDLKEAHRLFEIILETQVEESGFIRRSLGYCQLALGDQSGGKAMLLEGIKEIKNQREVEDVRTQIQEIEQGLIRWPYPPEVQGSILVEVRAAVDTAAASIHEPAPEEELEQVLQLEIDAGRIGSWTWFGAQAGLARLDLEAGHVQPALERYRQLQDLSLSAEKPEEQRFPEARLGLERALKAVMEAGDERLRAGELDAAQASYASLLENFRANPVLALEEIHSRLALVSFIRKDVEQAETHYTEALELVPGQDFSAAGRAMGITWSVLIPDSAHVWSLYDLLSEMEVSPNLSPSVCQALSATRQNLLKSLDVLFHLAPGAEEEPQTPEMIPIILEIGEAIVPKVDSRSDGGKFLFQDIPAMRTRIETDLGVKVPGVRARLYSGGPEEFAIYVNENLVYSGWVKMDWLYCLASPEQLYALGLAAGEVVGAPAPETQASGGWIPAQRQEVVQKAGLETWEDTRYLIQTLEAALRSNLESFLGVQEAASLVETYSESPAGAQLVAAALPGASERLLFYRLLRILVTEKTPVTDLEGILKLVQELGLTSASLGEVVQRARFNVRARLPGNAPQAQPVRLPPEWEGQANTWQAAYAETGAAPPPEKVAQLTTTLSGLLAFHGSPQVLVVRRPETRLFLSRILKYNLPDLVLLSAEEMEPVTAH